MDNSLIDECLKWIKTRNLEDCLLSTNYLAKALYQFIEYQRIYGEDSTNIINKQLKPIRNFTTQMKDYKKAIMSDYEQNFDFFVRKLVDFYKDVPDEFQESVREEFNHLLNMYLKKNQLKNKKNGLNI